MKSLFSRSLFVAFLVVTGLTYSYAQTTVNLPTIPCSTCNGPGAFATTAPACTSGLLGAPLTMSWGAASGATSYTIMIATDAALSQDVATYTLTGTSLSVPAKALKPQTTYYWTVVANNATGSTKATGSVCTFSTNTTWTGTSPTGGFPNGSWAERGLDEGLAGGYYTCQSGDGTCASGDNIICNPKFQQISAANPFVPNWFGVSGAAGQGGANLVAAGVGTPPTGTQTGGNTFQGRMTLGQDFYIRNITSSPTNYRLTLWARAATTNPSNLGGYFATTGMNVTNVTTLGGVPNSLALSTTWTQYTYSLSIAPGSAVTGLVLEGTSSNSNSYGFYVTDVVLCKL